MAVTPDLFDSEPLPAQSRRLYVILWRSYTNTCHDVCYPKDLLP